MPGQAQITSVAALEAFRSDLIVYLSQIRPVLDEAGGEVVRMKFWLQNDRQAFWENQARQRRRRLEEAQAELFNARLSTLQDSSLLQHLAVQRSQRAVQEAEQKMTALKKWDRDLENLAEPLIKQIDQLQGFLAGDMARAVAYLTQVIQALEAYTEVLSTGSKTGGAKAADNTGKIFMNLNANKSRLTALTKDISLRWAETRNYWRDAKSEEFDHRFMQELAPRVNKAANALEKLEELFKKIGKECE